jgi:hypothetical protein
MCEWQRKQYSARVRIQNIRNLFLSNLGKGIVIYITYYDCIKYKDGFYNRNMLLMVKQSCV